ncbi:hypothetical protein [Parapedobacter sp. 2B3]|uniref:hypothetical protein n=1 Tax=Parapedobacter sp. 2B3 TaxID=3342381 RepID=UPI0035B65F0C
MKLVLENVQNKHYRLLLEMAEALQFKVTELEPTEEEIDSSLGRAIIAGKAEGRLSEQEQQAFESWLTKAVE